MKGFGIGRLREKSLHASLKALYAAEGGVEEVSVAGYVADVKTPYGLVEIQTSHFSSVRTKLVRLLAEHEVRLVYPVAEEKKIVTLDEHGEVLSSRKSPKRGTPCHIGRELAAIRDLIGHPRFTLEILLTREEEIRIRDGRGSWRRKGVSLADRRLVGVNRKLTLKTPEDYLILLGEIPEPFVNRDLASRLGVPVTAASGLTRSLLDAGILECSGKKGNARLFIRRRSEALSV